MEKLTLFKRQKIIVYITILIGFTIFMLDVFSEEYHSFGTGFLLCIYSGFNLYELNKRYFKYNNEVFEYLLMYKEKKATITRSEIEKVTENWSGFIFTLTNGEQIKLSTDGLWKSDKKIISNFLKEQNYL